MGDKLDFPATTRNCQPILQVLQEHLPAGNVLEIASGSGQHVVHFAEHLPQNRFWPSDPDPKHVKSVQAWTNAAKRENIHPPLLLDTTDKNWQSGEAFASLPVLLDAILCINMIHIAPIKAATGLLAGAAKRLRPGGLLYLYGPFLGAGNADAASNLAFDADLKRRNAAWGVRQLDEVQTMANDAGFDFDQSIEMPANNLSVLFRHRTAD
ncbi:SAM-dependent methyltransferases [hydrothermal vent metagenome]|uniref:SAM-dependent methyltransferases n=1 Tax=hydrothermal vent metagenome TaxID=652676 RepID=A0A3B0RVY9_9ZZZZ